MIKVGDLVKSRYGQYGIVLRVESDKVWAVWKTTKDLSFNSCGKVELYNLTNGMVVLEKHYNNNINNGGNKMRKCITNVFKKTDDAVLVDEQFSSTELKDDFITGLLIEQNKTAILAEAKRRATPVKETGED